MANFSEKDSAQIKTHDLSSDKVERQIEDFKNGFEYLTIDRAAVTGDGILTVDDDTAVRSIDIYAEQQQHLRIVKFVPASGAATRMFKDLFEFVNDGKDSPAVEEVLKKIEKFAFSDKLPKNASSKETIRAIVEGTLNYGSMPKALIEFHKYPDGSRTAAEEHLAEGAMYAASNNVARIHFTVSPEHKQSFEALFDRILGKYEEHYGIKYNITFSFQKNSTDTIAVNPDNTPFRNDDGTLLFRPAGHGALIENLNDIDADIIFIKTVDNVAPDRLKEDTVRYKKILAGILMDLQNKAFSALRALEFDRENADMINNLASKLNDFLPIRLPEGFGTKDIEYKRTYLHDLLNRPIRVCGMVRNEGEPGGGPFWVREADGSMSLQIAESSQISPDQMHLMKNATHFNPVDIVCSVRDYRGKKFDLTEYVDPKTGFISEKSKNGRKLKALELPGLWNGAMSQWITVFVEVPITTFSPVKVVNDLLRDQHQQ